MFKEAQKLIDEYEKFNSPHFVMYSKYISKNQINLLFCVLVSILVCLLSGARNSRNCDFSKKIYNKMKYLFPDEKKVLVSGAILLANTYSSIGEYQLGKDFRYNQIKESGIKAEIGVSWTDATGEIVVKYFV